LAGPSWLRYVSDAAHPGYGPFSHTAGQSHFSG
jgi:hypothetical protein